MHGGLHPQELRQRRYLDVGGVAPIRSTSQVRTLSVSDVRKVRKVRYLGTYRLWLTLPQRKWLNRAPPELSLYRGAKHGYRENPRKVITLWVRPIDLGIRSALFSNRTESRRAPPSVGFYRRQPNRQRQRARLGSSCPLLEVGTRPSEAVDGKEVARSCWSRDHPSRGSLANGAHFSSQGCACLHRRLVPTL
ncbi:hypothetical protein VTK73DRAFT_933 [Phialemonium thermophilum]|uniref:Uncharacterized protein n=1 Tax=Phialemonium thermophilum TaxID=223376 RepID=A0ABR3VUA1_9PEZI